MGKGKRSKDRKNEEVLQNPSTAAKAPSNKTNTLTKVSLIVIAVILVATLSLVFIQSSGIILRTNTVFETENYKISGTMMQYMVNAQYQSFYAQYGSYATYFGLDTAKSLKEQAFNPSNSFVTMLMGLEDEYKDFKGTWYDYFWAKACDQAKSTLVYCEAAKAAGVSIGDEEKQKINDTIDSLYKDMDTINEENRKYYAENYGQPNFVTFNGIKEYLAATYGQGVSISDIRKTLELVSLSDKYYTQEAEKLLDKITDDRDGVVKYYEEHISNYYKADYITTKFTASYTAPTDKTQEDAKWAAYLEEVNKALDNAKALSECKTEEEFKTFMIKYWFEDKWQSQYTTTINKLKTTKNEKGDGYALTDDDIPEQAVIDQKKAHVLEVITDALLNEKEVEDFEPTGESAFDGAIDAIRDSLFSTLSGTSYYGGLEKEKAAFDDSNDIGKWTYEEDRAAGDNKYFASHESKFVGKTEENGGADAQAETTGGLENEEETPKEEEKAPANWEVKLDKTKKEDASFSVEVRYIVAPRYIIEDFVREFGHILITEDSFIKENKDLKEEEANKMAKEKAEKLLDQLKAGTVTKESFEALAKENTEDSGVFYDEVQPGMMVESVENWLFAEDRKAGDLDIVESDYGYHVMYYVETSDMESWYIDARNDFYSDSIEAWDKECKDKYTVTDKSEFAKNNINSLNG